MPEILVRLVAATSLPSGETRVPRGGIGGDLGRKVPLWGPFGTKISPGSQINRSGTARPGCAGRAVPVGVLGQQRVGERVKSSTVGVLLLIFVWRVWGFQPSFATISVSGLLRRSIQ